jgi:hypothetical protein
MLGGNIAINDISRPELHFPWRSLEIGDSDIQAIQLPTANVNEAKSAGACREAAIYANVPNAEKTKPADVAVLLQCQINTVIELIRKNASEAELDDIVFPRPMDDWVIRIIVMP